MPAKKIYASYYTSPIYLGNNEEAKRLKMIIQAIPVHNKDRWRSRNDFLLACVMDKLAQDRTIVLPESLKIKRIAA